MQQREALVESPNKSLISPTQTFLADILGKQHLNGLLWKAIIPQRSDSSTNQGTLSELIVYS